MEFLSTLHLVVAIALVGTLLAALVPLQTRGWTDGTGTWMRNLAVVATAQWILGFFVWFATISDEGFNLFTGLLHPLAMTGVLAASHMAAGKARRTEDVPQRAADAKRSLYIITALIVLLVPWRVVFGG